MCLCLSPPLDSELPESCGNAVFIFVSPISSIMLGTLWMILNIYETDHKAWRHYDDCYIFKQIFSFKNIIPLGWLTTYNKYDFAISNWKPFNFLISFIQFMLHPVESSKSNFFFLLLMLLGIFFAKHKNSLQLFLFKVSQAVYGMATCQMVIHFLKNIVWDHASQARWAYLGHHSTVT